MVFDDAAGLCAERCLDSGGQVSARKHLEIIVTAERQTETAQRTPISIVALSANTLRNERTATLGDVQSSIAGLAIANFFWSPQTLQAYIGGQGV